MARGRAGEARSSGTGGRNGKTGPKTAPKGAGVVHKRAKGAAPAPGGQDAAPVEPELVGDSARMQYVVPQIDFDRVRAVREIAWQRYEARQKAAAEADASAEA